MKKISIIFCLLSLFIFNQFSFGAEIISKELKIVKIDGLEGVEDTLNNETVIPCKYKKIKKIGKDVFIAGTKDNKWEILSDENKPILEGKFDKIEAVKADDKKDAEISNLTFYGIYKKKIKAVFIKPPKYNPEEVLGNIFEQNNKISKIKFYNYPVSYGSVLLKKNNKYGLLSMQKDYLIYFPPKYQNIYVTDSSSSAFKALGITYSNIKDIKLYDVYYWFNVDFKSKEPKKTSFVKRLALTPFIKEDIEIKDDEIVFNYQSSSNLFENVLLSGFPDKKEGYFGIGNITGYPENHIELNGDNLKIIENEKTYLISKRNYEDFYFHDFNTVIYKIKKISCSNPDRIFAKKDGFWGIIDKNENVISDFQYEKVTGLDPEEIAKLSQNGQKYDINYLDIVFPKNNIFLVEKDEKYAIIDEDGNVLIPYGEIINKDAYRALSVKNKALSKKILKNYSKNNDVDESVANFIETTTGSLISMPFVLTLPLTWPFILSSQDSGVVRSIFEGLF